MPMSDEAMLLKHFQDENKKLLSKNKELEADVLKAVNVARQVKETLDLDDVLKASNQMLAMAKLLPKITAIGRKLEKDPKCFDFLNDAESLMTKYENHE